jgi:hypothetical protein
MPTNAAQTLPARIRTWWHSPALQSSLRAALVSRLLVVAVGVVAVTQVAPAPNTGTRPASEIASLPGHWDASWYLGIAHGGYRWEGPGHRNSRLAFFPGYPMALRAVATVLRLPDAEVPWLWTGAALSTLFFWMALLYLHRLVESIADGAAANRAVLLLAAYPFSLFYGQVYSESMFLLCGVAAAFYAHRAQFLRAAFFGVLVGLVRPTGCLVSLILVFLVAAHLRAQGKARPTLWLGGVIAIVSPVLGTLAYSAYIRLLTGSWLTWMTDQAGWGRQLQNPLALVSEIAEVVRSQGFVAYLTARPYEALNVAAAVVALALAVPVARRLGLGYAAFVVLGVLAPLRVGGFASMGRYSSVLFPIFMWCGMSSTRFATPLAVAAAVAQGVLAALFYTDRPIF